MGAPVLSLLPLAVQILIPASAEEQQAILDACTRAHSGQPCERVEIGSEPDALRGRVSALGPSRVLVEVRAETETPNYLSVELSFSEQDQARERARSIGLSLGTLASSLEQQAEQKAAALDADKSDTEPSDSTKSESQPATSGMLPLRVGLGASYDLAWGSPALRADLRAQWAPSGGFFFGLSGSADFAPASSPRPTLLSVEGLAGVGYLFQTGAVYWFPELALGASFNSLNVEDSSLDTAQGTRTSAVGGASLHCLVPLSERVYLSLLPEVEVLLPSTEVYVDEEQVGGMGPVRFALTLGVAWNAAP